MTISALFVNDKNELEERNESPQISKLRLKYAGMVLPTCIWPGGYPIYYMDTDGCILCPKCANENDDFTAELTSYSVHWEGPPLICEHASCVIESAYGDPDEEGKKSDEEKDNLRAILQIRS